MFELNNCRSSEGIRHSNAIFHKLVWLGRPYVQNFWLSYDIKEHHYGLVVTGSSYRWASLSYGIAQMRLISSYVICRVTRIVLRILPLLSWDVEYGKLVDSAHMQICFMTYEKKWTRIKITLNQVSLWI